MTTITRIILVTTALAFTLGACSQAVPAVKGLESSGGGQLITTGPTLMTSDVQYFGASADGLILLRFPDGSVQGWRPNR